MGIRGIEPIQWLTEERGIWGKKTIRLHSAHRKRNPINSSRSAVNHDGPQIRRGKKREQTSDYNLLQIWLHISKVSSTNTLNISNTKTQTKTSILSMKIVFSQPRLAQTVRAYIPGLNAMRQDLLVHVPSGNIMIWKQATVRGEIPQYCSKSWNKVTQKHVWTLKLYGCHCVRGRISETYVWYLRPFAIRTCSAFDLLNGLPPRVLIRAWHEHRPNELDKS